MPVSQVILLIVIAVLCTAVITSLYVNKKNRNKVEYMLDAFEDGEYNFRFAEKSKFNKTLNRFKWIIDQHRQQHEQESWTKLIRVLTHEIMNTVSPIASLSTALKQSFEQPKQMSNTEIKMGLETISSSATDLIKFVESYRELAGIARPIKKALMVDFLVNKVIELTSQQCTQAGVTCNYNASVNDILIYADESQISRIFINLIKNAIQANAKNITINASINNNEMVVVTIANDGMPISKDSQNQIFIPFFTTKQEGSGIGLSLSRQIMQAHNGTIELTKSNESQTLFTLTFR